MLSRLEPSAGKLLISEPFLMDPNFKRSVVFLTEHQEEGTVGFILNQRSTLLLNDLVPDFTGDDVPVDLGGPVAIDTIHFIHRRHDLITDGEEIAKGVCWGGNFETLKVLINNHSIKPADIKFFIGYSGWSGQQLKNEMKENTWIVSDQFNADVVFSNNEEELWKEVIINLGPKYAHVSNFPLDPNLN
jgi:putative transcriptional regulator